MIEAQGEHASRQLQPLRSIPIVNVVPECQIRLIDGAVGPLEQDDRAIQETLHFRIRVVLRVVIERRARLVERFFDDDLAVEIGQHLPAPRLQDQPHSQEIPALLGLRFGVHVDQVLSERPVHVTPLHRTVVTPSLVSHSAPALCGIESCGRRDPLLRVMPDETAIVLRRRHEPMQHCRQIQIRRDRLWSVGVGVDVQKALATTGECEHTDQDRRVSSVHGQNPIRTPTLMPSGMGKLPKSIPVPLEPPTAALLPFTIGSSPV